MKREAGFLIPWAAIMTASLVLMASIPQIELHMMLNGTHSQVLDLVFRTVTHVGGNLPWILGIILLAYKMWAGAYVLAAQLAATIITTPLKYIFNRPRPVTVFHEAGIDLPLVEGIKMNEWLSFPSGHTSAAFALMMCISVMLPKWWEKTICLLIAVLTAYSRIYLSQHFLADTAAGSVIGIASALIIAPFFIEWLKQDTTTTAIYGKKG